ncbi:HAMP domain-containing histidine kinase [Candidatus Saccharibacteria bacterium]|nr:HAMP domain-containing histidine kinase [Candidatus Saccharibacteria bacterium]
MIEEVDGILLAAHELKVPLAVIRQLAFALDESSTHNQQIRTKIVSVSERAIRQVNDLAKIRRLEDGLFTMEPVAVREVCDAVSYELRQLFQYNSRDLHIKYKNKSKLVIANRDLLCSIVYNFLINAMHYSGDGAKTEMIVNEVWDKTRITVRDYGPALPMDIWREIKKGWMDKPTSIAMRPGSSGLGLYIASSFSRYMNAKIGAVRHKDGTSFYVELITSKQASLF